MKKNKKFMKFKAFTLAEVLITLAVIGVVASLTIPTLFHSYDENQLLTRWKKNFGQAATAVKRIYTEKQSGEIDFDSSSNLRTDFASVMRTLKEDTFDNFSVSSYSGYGDSSSFSWSTSSDPALKMLDGAIWTFVSTSATCADSSNLLENICGKIYIDVNGSKEPNKIGKDLFGIWIIKLDKSYHAYAMGSNNDENDCVDPATSAEESWGCSANSLFKNADDIAD